MKEYKKAQEKAQLHGVVNDAYDHDKKQNTQSQNSNDYPKQEYKMDSIHDKIESVHETDQNDLGTVPTHKIFKSEVVNTETTRYQIDRVKTFHSRAEKGPMWPVKKLSMISDRKSRLLKLGWKSESQEL